MIENEKLKIIVDLLKEKKTTSLKVLDISKISIIADYFIIVSVNNLRSVEALDNDITDKMSENGFDTTKKEGVHSKWVLIDYGDVVVHIFDDEYKEFYNLDKLWADANEIKV